MNMTLPLLSLALLLTSLSACPAAPALSESKLSLHLIARCTEGAERVTQAGPRALKILDLHEPMLQAARLYKSRYPQGRVVLRIYTQKNYPRDADPEASATDYWQTAMLPPLQRLSKADRALIDYLEGPNECEAYPAWESAETAGWSARFWVALADHMARAGFRPCVGSIPVGNPPGEPAEIEAKIAAFVPALRAARRHGGSWSYHAYTLEYSMDEGVERWYSLRYRMLHEMMVRHAPELADLPLILTEAGVDRSGNPQLDGWQQRGSALQYKEWLTWFDDRLREDPYVVAATLFQSGDTTGWPSFDTEPINRWLAGHLRRSRPVTTGSPGSPSDHPPASSPET